MARRLPPLSALRAFEAAARHLSFTRAAEELYVTQAAVSHQVKSLEQWLGLPLFRRNGRQVALSEAGQRYLPEVRDALDRLAEVTARLLADESGGPLTVSVLASFAANWLVPRLGQFRLLHPEIDVRISATDEVADFARDDVDMAIRYGMGEWPGLIAEPLLTEEIFPVCSPRLLQGPAPLRTPEDLRHHTLLRDDMQLTWRDWFRVAGVEGVNTERGPFFNLSALVVQAAIDGQGVALARSALVGRELAAGLLVRPFEQTLRSERAYYVVYPQRSADLPKLVAFRDWLLAAAAEPVPVLPPSRVPT